MSGYPLSKRSVELSLAAGTLGFIFVVAFVLQQPVWAGQPARPVVSSADLPTGVGWPGALVALAFAAAWSVPFRPYVLALRVAQGVSPRTLLVLTAALAIVALLIFPAFGSDLFVYAAYERLWTVYAENPLLTQPAAQPQDWAFQFVYQPYQPSPYGPLWAILTWPIAQLAGTSINGLVVGYKLLALLGYVTCCGLIWQVAQPDGRSRALIAFAWSPLVLFETLGKAHNDVLLAVAALLAVRASGWTRPLAAMAGGLVKLDGLAIMPSAALRVFSTRRLLIPALSMLGAVILAAAAYAPFWHGPQTLLLALAQTSRVVWSPGSLLIAVGLDQVVVRVCLAAVWLISTLLLLARVRDTTDSACLVLLASLLLVTTAFFAHYLVPAIALGALSTNPRLHRLLLGLSIGAMAAYAVEVLSLAFGPPWLGSPGFQATGSVVLLLPGCVTLLSECPALRLRLRPGRTLSARCLPRTLSTSNAADGSTSRT